MISALFDQPNYVATKKLLDATVLRHEAIASNLANVETPNYQRMDVNPTFQEALRQAIALKNPSQIASLQPQLARDASAVARKLDGNTVELEAEMAQLTQNLVAHAMETQMITGNLARLRLAITGRG